MRFILIMTGVVLAVTAFGERGYFRSPSLRGDTLVFAAEGDIWRVPVSGGAAQRLTTHPGEEQSPVLSPDGQYIAFSAEYEGPREVYVMPASGGAPKRVTYEAEYSFPTGWVPDGRVLYSTTCYSTLPTTQLATVGADGTGFALVPLSQADEGTYSDDGASVFFVRPPYHRNNTRNYKGGTARNIWRYTAGEGEAVLLTGDDPGEHYNPMWWQGRVYFICERSGTRNIWSMNPDGSDKQQLTQHDGWDVLTASLDNGRIAYRLGGDIHILDLATSSDVVVPITLISDFDQLRENWVDKPVDYVTSAHVHPEGKSVVFTSRGRVFVAPAKQGRLVQASRDDSTRYRDVVFSADGDALLGLSDATGEYEFVSLPADGVGAPQPITSDADILRFNPVPSPDGKYLAYSDKNFDLWVLDLASKQRTRVSQHREGIESISWSPDSRWLAYGELALNTYAQLFIFDVTDGSRIEVTSDRTNSYDAAWDPKGEFLYFLSDRDLESLVRGPWGPRQPEPYFDAPMRIYAIALRPDVRSPFKADDELTSDDKKEDDKDKAAEKDDSSSEEADDEDGDADDEKKNEDDKDKKAVKPIAIERDGLAARVQMVPVPPGNYRGLTVNDKALFFTRDDSGRDGKKHLAAVKITNDDPKLRTVLEDIKDYELSQDGKKILARKGDAFYVFDGSGDGPKLDESRVDLSGWSFAVDVAEDWRQIFIDAWRMERDYFYDPAMHGVDWNGVRDKYLPLVDRVTTRDELSDVIGMAVGELSALHVSVHGGDYRKGEDNVRLASLGARLTRDESAGGYRIDHIYRPDPDYPEWESPLSEPGLAIAEGDIIEAINGVETLSGPHPAASLRNQAGKQVRLRVKTPGGEPRDCIVTPTGDERMLRYRDWKYSRRVMVEAASNSQIGYVHLSAMGQPNLSEWYREFYPVFNRPGLIIDVRSNRGGNIDSILLEKLLRQAWAYFKGRVEEPSWNMQYAFRGHAVVLVNENTASDGEAFAEGFRRLGIGPVIGMRTWGGQIWLSDQNRLSDQGIARAPEYGVYDDEGHWLIEGHGVDPDIVVDNLPHATFEGSDAQLQAAIDYLTKKIADEPVTVPAPPTYPDLTP